MHATHTDGRVRRPASRWGQPPAAARLFVQGLLGRRAAAAFLLPFHLCESLACNSRIGTNCCKFPVLIKTFPSSRTASGQLRDSSGTAPGQLRDKSGTPSFLPVLTRPRAACKIRKARGLATRFNSWGASSRGS